MHSWRELMSKEDYEALNKNIKPVDSTVEFEKIHDFLNYELRNIGKLSSSEILEFSISSLAWLGDAIYEQYFRLKLFEEYSRSKNLSLHNAAKFYVSAKAQAEVYDTWLGLLEEKELDFFKRAKNFKSKSLAKNTDSKTYHMATAVEALCAYLYLLGKNERLAELLALATKHLDKNFKK